ncbi:uncharacterized protein LOC124649038 isoform X2 [Lolium rigidum]|uniref:uncharacterized protein LOC124649038 isoform X2 n=1 Tax=Lolium rigidum TaxID=89674 RepID=UPI001F5C1E24|nr:uncharacterized protein LOC124649038 isoform X2 [Lolium rigidum]XP_051228266.1 uncharacterized protein LOC127345782 isoform X2 [Lolium perenne]
MAALGRPPRSSIVSDSDLGFNLLQDWNNWLPFTSHRDFYSKEGASENFVSGCRDRFLISPGSGRTCESRQDPFGTSCSICSREYQVYPIRGRTSGYE